MKLKNLQKSQGIIEIEKLMKEWTQRHTKSISTSIFNSSDFNQLIPIVHSDRYGGCMFQSHLDPKCFNYLIVKTNKKVAKILNSYTSR